LDTVLAIGVFGPEAAEQCICLNRVKENWVNDLAVLCFDPADSLA